MLRCYYKPEPTPVDSRRRATPRWAAPTWSGQDFRWCEPEHLGPPAADLVHFNDVRFMYPDGDRRPLQAYVLLDSNHHVEAEGFESPKGWR